MVRNIDSILIIPEPTKKVAVPPNEYRIIVTLYYIHEIDLCIDYCNAVPFLDIALTKHDFLLIWKRERHVPFILKKFHHEH